MKTYEYEYALPVGDPDMGAEADVVFVYTWTPGRSERIRYDEHDRPAEGDEIDLIRVDVVGERRPYRKHDTPEAIEQAGHDAFHENDDNLYGLLIENARDYDEYRRDEAAEAKREMRKDDKP